ncbi:energy transducer TonB [Cytophagaceae bacterium ABcell3]|nr:energy transducer TonB [Cytophagaceae bacterium ABcell3]
MEKVNMVEVRLEDIPPPVESSTPPPPPKIEVPKLATVKFLPPEVKPDEEVIEDLPPTVEELAESNAGAVTQEGELTLDEIIVVDDYIEEIVEEEPEEIYTWVAEMPEFKGGDEALMRFLGDRIKYPKVAIKNNVEGDVWIEFIVNKDGSLSDFKVLRNLGHGCDEEALRVAQQMPAWKPAYQNGKPVMLKKKMRISFKFQN